MDFFRKLLKRNKSEETAQTPKDLLGPPEPLCTKGELGRMAMRAANQVNQFLNPPSFFPPVDNRPFAGRIPPGPSAHIAFILITYSPDYPEI